MKPRILVIGGLMQSIIFRVKSIPSSGGVALSEGYSSCCAGRGALACTAVALLGGDGILCTRVGGDDVGRHLTGELSSRGVDIRFITADKSLPTALEVMLLEQNGSARTVIYPGAAEQLNHEDAENAFMSYPDALLTSMELDSDLLTFSCSKAAGQDIPVFLDAGWAKNDFPFDKLKNIEIFTPDEDEALMLTGVELRDTEKCLQACVNLWSRIRTKYIVLKLSDRGCFIYDGKYCEFVPSYNVDALDTTGAGDAFTASLTLEYMRSKNIIKACKYANAVGALTVSKLGAIESLPDRRLVDRFITAES